MAKQTKKKVKKNITHGICHIQASFNNTIVTFTDPQGKAFLGICWWTWI
jgi:small subunit ribosomal protein S11